MSHLDLAVPRGELPKHRVEAAAIGGTEQRPEFYG